MSISGRDDILSASHNLAMISNELKDVNRHLTKINENMKASIRGEAGNHLTSRIIPAGIKKALNLSDQSMVLSKRLNAVIAALDSIETNIEDTSLGDL